jgi:monothiol glutaredoxin
VSELREQIENVIQNEDVALFMKGTPQFVMCGNSMRALEALRRAGAPVTAVDVLPDPRFRQELSAVSNWPTIPQVFVGGELIGGATETLDAWRDGKLQALLRAHGGVYDATVQVEPKSFLPTWLAAR